MKTPSALSTWFMVLYFLMVALGAFGVFSNAMLEGVFAAGAAITLFIGR